MASYHLNPDSYFILENIGSTSALFSFGVLKASIFRVVVSSEHGDKLEVSTGEYNFIARLLVKGLSPEVNYTAVGYAGSQELSSTSFCTLGTPDGKALARFAVVADTHISIDRENRRGRLFAESSSLLRETSEVISNEGCEAVIIPGDVTDRGDKKEAAEAERLLSFFNGEVFIVPGDHDTGKEVENPEDRHFVNRLWSRAVPFSVQWKGLRVVGIDTSSGRLDEGQLLLLKEALLGKDPVIIASHYNLLNGSISSEKESVIENSEVASKLLFSSNSPWVIYTGHINIPSRLDTARGWQINSPQVVHYPSGFFTVDVYREGLLHQFVPIKSEILRNYSLRMLGQDSSPFFKPGYRYGSLSGRSFFLSWESCR